MVNRSNLVGMCIIVFLMVHIMSYPTVTNVTAQASDATIRVENGLLQVSVNNTPLIDLLEELADQTGIGFEIYADADRKITAKYDNIPLEEGLKRILRPNNHIILYAGKNSPAKKPKIYKIIIYDQSGGSSGQGIRRQPTKPGNREMDDRTVPMNMEKTDEMETEKPIEEYAKQLNDADPDVREEALTDMAEEYGEAALIYLEKALIHDGNDEVRSTAAEEIGDLENVRGIEILAKGLNDPDEDVREAVVEALGNIGGKNALPVLRRAVKDKNEDIREAAADLIEEIEEE